MPSFHSVTFYECRISMQTTLSMCFAKKPFRTKKTTEIWIPSTQSVIIKYTKLALIGLPLDLKLKQCYLNEVMIKVHLKIPFYSAKKSFTYDIFSAVILVPKKFDNKNFFTLFSSFTSIKKAFATNKCLIISLPLPLRWGCNVTWRKGLRLVACPSVADASTHLCSLKREVGTCCIAFVLVRMLVRVTR